MAYRFFFLIPIFLNSFLSVAQRDETSISLFSGDTTRVNSLVEESYKLREKNPVKAIDNCLTAIGLAKQLEYKKGQGRALGSLGWVYYRKGDFLKALEISNEALEISEQIGDEAETARSLNNVAAIYWEENQYDRALENIKRGLYIARHIHDTKTILRSLNNIAVILRRTYPDSTRFYATQALVASEKARDDYDACFANYTLAELAADKGNYAEALQRYKRVIELSGELSERLRLKTWLHIANVYIHQRRIPDAVKILEKNIEMASQKEYREERQDGYQLLAEAYKQTGNFALAFDYLQRYTVLHDSIYRERSSSRLATLQSQSDLDKKQAQIELLTKDTLLNKKEISRQRIQLYATVGGFLGILLLAALLFYGNRKINRSNILLEQQTAQLERINSTKDKLFSIISHDFRSPLNSLKGVLALLENKNLSQVEFSDLAEKLKKNFNAVSNDLENLLQWSLAQLQGIQTNSGRINVYPIVQEHVALFQEIAKSKEVKIENKIGQDLFAMADEDHIRLVLRNLINNAVKFTPPGGSVEISSHHENPYVEILVKDTGVGIGSEQLENLFQKDKPVSTVGTNREKGVGLGLLLCQEFVENNGGQLNVASELGKGSVFSFTLRAA